MFKAAVLFCYTILILRSGAGQDVNFDSVYNELQKGRSYSSNVKKGFFTIDRKTEKGIQLYALILVPHNYSPEKKYPVRITLHGATSSLDPYNVHNFIDTSLAAYDSVKEIRIYPSSYFAARWYYAIQYENVIYLLDYVKRHYNVDENRVSLGGFSDGGSGTYAFANFNPTSFSCFMPLIGICAGLTVLGTKEFYFNKLRNKPMFIVNGKRDEMFPPQMVVPYVETIQRINPQVTFYNIDSSGHSLNWLPLLKDTIDRFLHMHPRHPFPDHLIWQTENTQQFNRNHWVIINRLGKTKSNADDLKDVNTIMTEGKEVTAFRRDTISGIIEVTRSGNTVEVKTKNIREYTLLISPDQFDMTSPLKVYTNAILSYEGIPEKSIATLLKWNELDSDRTMLFASEILIRVGKEFK